MTNKFSPENRGSFSSTVLVTGANGQLGRRLLPRLQEAGYQVRAHYRNAEKAAKYYKPEIKAVIGDLRSPAWIDDAVRGCDIVVHGAARVSLRLGNLAEQKAVNIDGARAVVEACLKHNVRRLIYVSTIVTVGASLDGNPVDESLLFNLAGFDIPYIDTKHEAETIALAANSRDFEVIVVNPSIMISPPDREVTARDLRKIPRFLPAYFDFGLNLVETDDVISGIIAAFHRGRPGERYLLTGENVNPERLFELAGKYFGINKPVIKIPISALYPVAYLVELWAQALGKRPKFHRGLARLAHYRFFYNNEKAKRELGYTPKPLETTIENILGKLAGEESWRKKQKTR